ncbi:MAG: helix-turn-helix domain-containing protein [Candidatus Nanopelagicales bacterium]
MRELDTTEAASAYIGAAVGTLRYWRHRGLGPPSFKVGRRVLYRRDDLDKWLDAQYAATVQGEFLETPPIA